MSIFLKRCLMIGFVGCLVVTACAMQKNPPVPATNVGGASSAQQLPAIPESTTQGLLIFLDDSEHAFGAITSQFFGAFTQETGPIIVSASILANLKEAETVAEKNPRNLARMISNVISNFSQKSAQQSNKELRDLLAAAFAFEQTLASKWVMKEVNPQLYVLLPNKYLEAKEIKVADVNKRAGTVLSFIEQKIGLKVNHMRTVGLQNVHRSSYGGHVNYFVNEFNKIFVRTRDYPRSSRDMIPQWVIYLDGHGMIGQTICGLPFEQFSVFLDSLEQIKTKLLMYLSCYAAGTNTELIYTDVRSGAKKTYSFAIVTYALTDAPVTTAYGVASRDGEIMFTPDFVQFMQAAKLLDASYKDILSSINVVNIAGVPQIKYPGLTWFSVFDRSKVAPIGSILAKTRTEPLHMATFFAEKRGGESAAPMGILLYADTIPFEIVVDTERYEPEPNEYVHYVPTFVSMIPGNAVHFLKKISSRFSDLEEILHAFYIPDLQPRKVFIIDEITARFTQAMKKVLQAKDAVGTLSRVVVESNQGTMTTYFTFAGRSYIVYGKLYLNNPGRLATPDEQENYRRLLSEKGAQAVLVTKELMRGLEEKAGVLFKDPVGPVEAAQKITDLLRAMPNDTMLHIRSIQTDIDAGYFDNLVYPPSNVRKVLWIDNFGPFNDVIFELVPEGTTIFYRQGNRLEYVSNVRGKKFERDYRVTYEKLFDDFEKRLTLQKDIEERSLYQLLTLDSINALRARLAGHAARAAAQKPVAQQVAPPPVPPRPAVQVTLPPVPPRAEPKPQRPVPAPAPQVAPPPVPPRPAVQPTPPPVPPRQEAKPQKPASTSGAGSSAPEKNQDVDVLVRDFVQTAKIQMPVEQAIQKMIEILNVLPSGATLALPEILPGFKVGASKTFVTGMTKYHSVVGRKTVLIKQIGGDANNFSNVIIDSTMAGTRVLYTFRGSFKEEMADSEKNLKEDYLPTYNKMFSARG